jgi:hypothetical protein
VGTNTYATAAEADAYMATRLGATTWTAATADQRAQALIGAYQVLEALRWQGDPVDYTQPGQWPRTSLYDVKGEALDDETMPEFLRAAQAEEALALLQINADADAGARAALQMQGVRTIRVDRSNVEEQYGARPRKAGLYSVEAYRLIQPYLLRWPSKVVMP